MSEPEYCYKCQEILTFCECAEPILSEGDWQRWAAGEISRLTTEVSELRAVYEAAHDWIHDGWGDIKKTDELHAALEDAVNAVSGKRE